MSPLLNLRSSISSAGNIIRTVTTRHDARFMHFGYVHRPAMLVLSSAYNKPREALFQVQKRQSAQSTSFKHSVITSLEDQTAATSPTSNKQRSVPSSERRSEKAKVTPDLPDFLSDIQRWFKMEDLFTARVHLGHKVGCRNPHMSEFLYGERLGIDVFNLDRTVPHLQDALNFVAHCAYRGGVILLRAHQPFIVPEVESCAQRVGEYAHCRPWQQGTLTNTEMVFGTAIRQPDCVVALTALTKLNEPDWALTECAKSLIPTIAVCDSNADPRLVTYIVPGNDDSPVSLRFYIKMFERAIRLGKGARTKEA